MESRNTIKFKMHYSAGGFQRRGRGKGGKEREALSQFDVYDALPINLFALRVRGGSRSSRGSDSTIA